ncbi:E3 ubiquitin-protein ligase LRSAM1-like isoform X2 [Limulus polyphemus]|nr:E3 ubiquitin-protein ligase LRSAM1-like isoform X2 [Limulus polyphemus]
MCRVFRKKVLLLQDNCLTTLKGGGVLDDLQELKVLNLNYNKIKELPECFSCLKKLKILNLRGNKLQYLPSVICKLPQLQTLDIKDNQELHLLPKELSLVQTLITLTLDCDQYSYPPTDICKEGTTAILKFLSSENGTEFVSPHQHKSSISDSLEVYDDCTSIQNIMSSWSENNLFEKRKQDLLQMEEAVRQTQKNQAQAVAETIERRMKLLEDVANEQDRIQKEVALIQAKKEREKQVLLSSLTMLEVHSAQLINQILNFNEKHTTQEQLIEVMKRERQETEELLMLRKEEQENLCKKDILESMRDMLRKEEKQKMYEVSKQEMMRKMHNSFTSSDEKLQELMTVRYQDQQALLYEMLEEECYQKQAFEILQLQRDKKNREFTQKIKLVEKELTKLTGVELKKKDLKVNFEMNTLAEKRTILAHLLSELYKQQNQRKEELKRRINEMEERRAAEVQDYWLIQFQRLLDQKPQELIYKELNMDPQVKELLTNAGAVDYITLFATKEISKDKLISMTENDLSKLGVTNNSVREAIMNVTYRYNTERKTDKELITEEENRQLKHKEISSELLVQSAEGGSFEPVIPSAPTLTQKNVQLWTNTECVVCLESESAVIFLPCGHVCCCWTCAEPLVNCPMCRSYIQNKLFLGGS